MPCTFVTDGIESAVNQAKAVAGDKYVALMGSQAARQCPLDPLWVNTAAWDTNYVDAAIPGDLSAASLGLIRYPGGSWADQYLWQPNTVNGSTQPVDFAQYSSQTDAISGGQKFVTINYGSDTPQSAAAWVRQSATSGEGRRCGR